MISVYRCCVGEGPISFVKSVLYFPSGQLIQEEQRKGGRTWSQRVGTDERLRFVHFKQIRSSFLEFCASNTSNLELKRAVSSTFQLW
jgi:hypothetical protein